MSSVERSAWHGILACAIFALGGCSSGDGSGGYRRTETFTLRGTVSGLTSGSLVLAVNGDTVRVPANSTSVVLASDLASGTSYSVSVQAQPAGETCSVASGNGTIGFADVSNVVVTCARQAFALGGTITGLSASGLVLSNGADMLPVDSGATTFTMPTRVAYTSSYDIKVQAQPSGLTCAVSQGSGAMPASAVGNVTVTCSNQPFSISGTVVGLGNNVGLILTNGADTVTVSAGATRFAMPTAVAFGSSYAVAVGSHPTGLSCSVTNGNGTMGAGNVTSVVVTCSNRAYGLSGTITGLNASGLVLANGSDAISLSPGATTFAMNALVAYTGGYEVLIQQQPTAEVCSIENGRGTMGAADVTDIHVVCGPKTVTIAGSITGLGANTGLVLLNNGTDATSISANATMFTLTTGVVIGSGYDITVGTQPYGIHLACTVSNGSGTATDDVTSVAVDCNSVSPQQKIIAGYFNTPWGVAVDMSGNLFVADTNNKSVRKLSLSDGHYGAPVTIATGFNTPVSITVDADGNLFVADHAAQAVKRIPFVNGSYGTPVAIGSGFVTPVDMVIDANGNVLVSDLGDHTIKQVGVNNGSYDVVTTIASGFSGPRGLTLDATGNVFIADGVNVKIMVLDHGAYVAPAIVTSVNSASTDVAVDDSGNLLVADAGLSNVLEIPFSGGAYGTPISLLSFSHAAWAIALDAGGNVFMADRVRNTIFQIPVSNGSYGAAVSVESALGSAFGAVADEAGNVFVPDATAGTVKVFRSITGGYAPPVIIGSGFNGPRAVALDAAGNVFVTDTFNDSVKQIPFVNGNYAAPITLASGLGQPSSIAVDSAGNVFVNNNTGWAVQEIPFSNGSYGPPITIASDIGAPKGVAVDAARNVFVTGGDSIVKVPFADGSYGPPITIAATGFSNPIGVAVDAVGNVFVADSNNDVIKEIPYGNGSYGAPVPIGSDVRRPLSVAVDPLGRVYVVDAGAVSVLFP